ncbi:MAG: hypothetical protein WCI03_13915 [bacterium]
MNEEVIRSEAALVDVLRKVLDKSIFRIVGREDVSSSHHHDLTLKIEYEGCSVTFNAECKLNPSASILDGIIASASGKNHPLLVAVKLSESLVEQCRQRGLSCLDLNGRIWIKAPGLLIDRNLPGSTVRYRLAQPEIRFFSPKSTRLPRALLYSPDRIWRQSDLAAETDLSQGLLSRLLNYAANQGWVEGRRGAWKLANADALLDAWERVDVFSKRVTLKQYSTLEPNLRTIAHLLLDHTNGELAFTQWFAASLRHPYTDLPIVSAYRRNFPADEELRALNYREVGEGGKIWILVPRDEGLFKSLQQVEGLPLVGDAQIYLDLIHAGLRGPEQAKALREWKGFCRK